MKKTCPIAGPIAIVGMSGIFPGAPNVDIFWQNIVNRVEAIADVPPGRWVVPPEQMHADGYVIDRACSRRAGLIEPFQADAEGLAIDPDLLKALDPLYHLVLAAGRDLLRDCPISTIDKKRTGVVLAAIALPTDASSALARTVFGPVFENIVREKAGIVTPGHTSLENVTPLTRAECLSARVTSLPGALLAESLGLGGGSYTLDAACASSLYAVKLACDALASGRSDVMVAGGVSRPDSLYTQVGFTQLQALSPTGRCAPFDRTANGLVVGEGVGMVVLKRLSDAVRDGNTILSVIHGIGLANDIGGNLLAPDSEGQVRAMEAAYALSGWTPKDIDHIECHGAGTPVGDAIELKSLRTLWRDMDWTAGQCAIGSIKSMIGHLLTGAGAAGLVKTLLGLKHRVLPPSLNFSSPADNSPLNDSPFRVQTHPQDWESRDGGPRRAAVSAFGFGGINAHLLLEEWQPEKAEVNPADSSMLPQVVDAGTIAHGDMPERPADVAVVGMESMLGGVNGLSELQDVILNGRTVFTPRPKNRWRGTDALAEKLLQGKIDTGAFMEDLSVSIGEFHIQPNEIPDLLPQHLLMLKAAAGAMANAGLPHRQDRPRMGLTIGIEFDMEATDFHLRWNLINEARKWIQALNLDATSEAVVQWIEALRDACNPPLTSARTVGALGGIIASRIAKEFRLGGPSFVVSCESASGIKALDIGVRSLQQHETDAFLVGAVDLPADIRSLVMADAERPYRPYHNGNQAPAFDKTAQGALPGEGAVAVVLKRLDDAIADGDRIYAVIKGMGQANGGGLGTPVPLKEAYLTSLERCFEDARVRPDQVSYIETHGSGHPDEDRLETDALLDFFTTPSDGVEQGQESPPLPAIAPSIALGSLKPNVGHLGAAAGLAGLVKTALCLYQEIVPVMADFESPREDRWHGSPFHFPRFPFYWYRDRADGPRRACVCAMTTDGNCSHVLLEGHNYGNPKHSPEFLSRIAGDRKKPLGMKPVGLFVVEGDSKTDLIEKLDALHQYVRQAANTQAGTQTILEETARAWYAHHAPTGNRPFALTLLVSKNTNLGKWVQEAKTALSNDTPRQITGAGGIKYTPNPIGQRGDTAFVFPGSGNHYVGMGRGIGNTWPEVLRSMDAATQRFKTQSVPHCFVPFRTDWADGWETDAARRIASDPHHMIFGQVVHGGVMANLAQHLSLKPQAVIGYSLGESAGLFALRAWPERGQMLERMLASDLFRTELAGPCNAARRVWRVPRNEEVEWRVAVVNRPAEDVKKVLRTFSAARLLIVNTPNECVIGGRRSQVEAAVQRLGCDAFYLDGVVTVHCEAAVPAKEAYKALHIFPTRQPAGIRFYSCTYEKAYELTSDKAATSILNQALFGFDFTTTIRQAYKDGVRVFLEMGPQASCSRMIGAILEGLPHVAVSACAKGEDDYLTILKLLGTLFAEGIPVDLEAIYGQEAYPSPFHPVETKPKGKLMTLAIGRQKPSVPAPPIPMINKTPETPSYQPQPSRAPGFQATTASAALSATSDHPYAQLIAPMQHQIQETTEAHNEFLAFSDSLNQAFAQAVEYQTQLLESLMAGQAVHPGEVTLPSMTQISETVSPTPAPPPVASAPPQRGPAPAYDRDLCMAFAIGAVADVLGPEFAVVDTYPVRVRLPDEPLMLVDRIMSVEGEKASLGSGKVVTEHDVKPGAWYLDGGRAPVCISIEAGQADLFLCAYLGIDLAVKGKRAYRLLDAVATFHSGLPQPGDTIRYEIEIDKFIRQGETYLFFFRFNGYIGQKHIISMRKGCAGFFTAEEVKNSGGIILTDAETRPEPGKCPDDWKPLVPVAKESYDDAAVNALRAGDAGACFGKAFQGITLPESIRLPRGRMKLIDRIQVLDSEGGRFGLGTIRAEADIHPDDWFLTCHFVDDMVMPGTLMYECCAHTLRVLLLRMGWVTNKPDVCYEPIPDVGAVLKCRGPVTTETQQVIYQIDIKEIGFRPEPYVLADALMYADGERIVMFRDMSMKMTGLTREDLIAFWENRNAPSATAKVSEGEKPTLYTREQLLAYCQGKPSEAFGEPYKIFDQDRIIARLPRPPYFFMDRITRTDPPPWELKAGGWIESEYLIPPDAWYFKANRIPGMAFCILLEIALQPCGWLAAYCGSALHSETDLKFRNLGGKAILSENLSPESGLLTMRARMTKVSEAGGMIIEDFDMEVLQDGRMIYKGDTYFGFFSYAALANQIGIQNAAKLCYQPTEEDIQTARTHDFADEAPLSPDDPDLTATVAAAMPAKALRMIDRVALYAPQGGPQGLGFIRGTKTVDPDEWFFQAHFYQDPVCPGSLGIESFIQLMKFMALDRWPHLADTHVFETVTDVKHEWLYRGQVIPKNKEVEVDTWVTRITDEPEPCLFADGFLKVDGLFIYQMKNFGIRLVPAQEL